MFGPWEALMPSQEALMSPPVPRIRGVYGLRGMRRLVRPVPTRVYEEKTQLGEQAGDKPSSRTLKNPKSPHPGSDPRYSSTCSLFGSSLM